MSLRQIANQLGITPAYLSYMVNGKRPWRRDLFARYSYLIGDTIGQGPDICNLSACHNCALLAGTSCELLNKLLDRATIVGNSSSRSGKTCLASFNKNYFDRNYFGTSLVAVFQLSGIGRATRIDVTFLNTVLDSARPGSANCLDRDIRGIAEFDQDSCGYGSCPSQTTPAVQEYFPPRRRCRNWCRWTTEKPSDIALGVFSVPRKVERVMGIEPTTTCLGIKRQSVPTCRPL